MRKNNILRSFTLIFMILNSLVSCTVLCEHKRYKKELRPMVKHYCNQVCKKGLARPSGDLEHKLRCVYEKGSD